MTRHDPREVDNLRAIGSVPIGLPVPSTSLTIPLPCGLGKPTHGKAVPDLPGDPR
jgi:hypothetical protein